jgi:site-specific DNA recombinase
MAARTVAPTGHELALAGTSQNQNIQISHKRFNMLFPPTLRVAIYGRHSTSKQNPCSTGDQIVACEKYSQSLGGTVIATFSDPEESGYKRNRPEFKKLFEMIENKEVDVIICEALDRLARDAEDVAYIGKKFAYHDVKLYTVSDGHIDELKLSVACLMGSIFLKSLIDKTIRGMGAAVLDTAPSIRKVQK